MKFRRWNRMVAAKVIRGLTALAEVKLTRA
jgi:hypothetical protein